TPLVFLLPPRRPRTSTLFPYSTLFRSGGYSWELRIQNDGRFAAIFYQTIGPDVYTSVASPLPYNDGTWHHAAGVLRSGLAELFVDGLLVAQATTNSISSIGQSSRTEGVQVSVDSV